MGGAYSFPERYRHVTLERVLPDGSKHKKILEKIVANPKKVCEIGVGVLFYGETGVGKTSCAVLAAKALLRAKYTYGFFVADDLIDWSAAADAVGVDVAVLDGYPAKAGSIEALVGVLQRRYHHRRPSFVTYDGTELEDFVQAVEAVSESMAKKIRTILVPVKVAGHRYIDDEMIAIREFMK